ncbi:LacI family transcriptional regulator [Chloroflexi bacterium TSY]|nr:LacI family transcriptional regulator [Chloroflexi bacterium TSY]
MSTVTLRDVAADANVSKSTVSLVLRNSPLVADATRMRVLTSIDKLGYVYNRGAASIRSQRSHLVGLIVPDIRNPFFAEIAMGAEDQLADSAYVSMLANTSGQYSRQEQMIAAIQEHQIDGVLFCPTLDTPRAEIEKLQRQTATVLLIRNQPDLQVDCVDIDNIGSAELAIAHLISKGHQRITFIGSFPDSPIWSKRFQGYRQQLDQHNLNVDPELIVHCPTTGDAGHKAILGLLQLPKPPTAALCFQTSIAYGVMLGLQSSGLTPGRDFAVIGIDELPEAALWQPAITTVSIEPYQIGQVAARLLLKQIEKPDKAAERIMVPARLIVRESCGE